MKKVKNSGKPMLIKEIKRSFVRGSSNGSNADAPDLLGARMPLTPLMRSMLRGLALLTPLAAGSGYALTDDEVLARFARATDLPLPQVVQSAGGPTQLVWNTTLDLSVYRNTQTGGAVLNPNANGTLHRGVLSTDYRRVSEGDVTTWASAQITQTNDITSQRHKFLTNKVQIGYSQPGFVGAIGDLAVSHSNLSTNLPLRGVQAQSYLGPVVASAAAGLFVEDWKSAFDKGVRPAYPREAYAFKLASAPNAFDAAIKGFDVYATAQSFSDQPTNTARSPLILNPLNGAKGASASVGASYKYNTFAANIEFAKSRFDEEGRARLNDDALMGDVSWQGDPASLPIAIRLGHHNIGEDFSTLSTVAPGTRESFGNISWRVTTEFSATLDARQSRYTPNSRTAIIPPPPVLPNVPPDPFAPPIPAIVQPPKVITDSESASLNFSYAPAAIQGFNTTLTLGRAKTEQVGADVRTQSDNASVNVNYAISGWNTGVNLTHMKNDAFGVSANSAKTTGATVNLGKSFADSTGQRSVNALVSYMKQWQDNSANAFQPASKGWNDRVMLTLGFNWVNVGMLNASAYLGHLKDPLSGAVGKQEGAQLDLTWTINPKWNLRAFGRENRNWTALAPQAYKDRSIGASIVGTF
jgi:hypothetical protein